MAESQMNVGRGNSDGSDCDGQVIADELRVLLHGMTI